MLRTFTGNTLELAALAARLLGWTPATFWTATPAELAACLGPGKAGAAPPSRSEIDRMIERDRNE